MKIDVTISTDSLLNSESGSKFLQGWKHRCYSYGVHGSYMNTVSVASHRSTYVGLILYALLYSYLAVIIIEHHTVSIVPANVPHYRPLGLKQ